MNDADLAVRDAMQRMSIPAHGPDFWDQVAGRIDKELDRTAKREAKLHAVPEAPVVERSAAIPPTLASAQPPRPALPIDPRRVVIDGPGGPPEAPAVAPAALPANVARFPVRPEPSAVTPQGRQAAEARRGASPVRHRGEGRHHGRSHVRIERDLSLVPRAMKEQRSNAALAAMAVAAVALVVFAGGTLVRQRSGSSGGDTFEATNTAFSSDALAASGNDPAARAVLAWVSQLGGGDADASWDALGPASQAHFGSRADFDDEFDALKDGYGAWAGRSADVVLITPVSASSTSTVSVVTLIGTVGSGSSQEQRADAFPVRISAGVAKIEAFADAGSIGLEAPDASQGAEMSVDDTLSVLVPAGVSAPIIRLDQGPAQRCGEAVGTTLVPVSGKQKQRCTYTPEGGMEAGGRVLTVAFASPDGTEISARSVRFKAA